MDLINRKEARLRSYALKSFLHPIINHDTSISFSSFFILSPFDKQDKALQKNFLKIINSLEQKGSQGNIRAKNLVFNEPILIK